MDFLTLEQSKNLLFKLLNARAQARSSWNGKVAKAKANGFHFDITETKSEGRSMFYTKASIERLAEFIKAIPAKPNKRNAK
jgi:hypothetical protein